MFKFEVNNITYRHVKAGPNILLYCDIEGGFGLEYIATEPFSATVKLGADDSGTCHAVTAFKGEGSAVLYGDGELINEILSAAAKSMPHEKQ